jgi:hypothetical protein
MNYEDVVSRALASLGVSLEFRLHPERDEKYKGIAQI